MTSTTITTPSPPASDAARERAERPAPKRLAAGAATVLVGALLTATLAVAGAAAAGVAPHVELSDSMAPVLRAGDVVWLDGIGAGDARVGDVVAFDDPERAATVLHRVERVRATGRGLAFTTRGDANNAPESWTIARDGRVGRYVGVRVPHAGRLVRALQGPPLAVIALLSGAALAALALRRIWSS